VRGRHGHRHAAEKGGGGEEAEGEIGRQAHDLVGLCRALGPFAGLGGLGRRLQENERERQDDNHHHEPIAEHGLLPAVGGDRPLEQGWQAGAGHVLAAREKREGRTSALLEPTCDVDVERCVDGAVAEKTDQEPVPQVELPNFAARG
jgi:hypothetical protein